MQTAKIIRYRRALLLVGMVALVAATLVLPAPRTASAAGLTYECDYYDSPAHTTWVGWRYRPCTGLIQQSGTITPYKDCLYERECPSGGGGGH